MNFRPAILAAFLFCAAARAERPAEPLFPKGAELYSWRIADGSLIFAIRAGNKPSAPEILLKDKSYQMRTQAELAQAFEKLGVGESVFWHHLNLKGKSTLPPEEIEVETKETAMKARVNLSIWSQESLEPEYWNQPRGRYDDAVKKLEAELTDEARLQVLRTAAKEAFLLGLYPEAKKHATDLEALTPKLKESWNYGDAIQEFNLILGRIALKEADIDTARGHLLAAGYSPGSPVMNSLGPDMSLARDLLEKGERKVVLQYLDLCRNFWKTDHGLIDQWSEKIKNGKNPDFSTNLRE